MPGVADMTEEDRKAANHQRSIALSAIAECINILERNGQTIESITPRCVQTMTVAGATKTVLTGLEFDFKTNTF